MSNQYWSEPLTFAQIHIEAARNSTDDFNFFHDKNRWARVQGNPFGGPIVLGFQLECLLEYRVFRLRNSNNELPLIQERDFRFSNYQVAFINVVRPNEAITVGISKSQLKSDPESSLSNRVVVKSNEGPVLLGFKKESIRPLYLEDWDLSVLPALDAIADRSYIQERSFFLKRKYFNTGNAKNFLSGSLAEQSDYFDELEGKVSFPEIFPVSLISCALLEKAVMDCHDFEKDPMIYTRHRISVDRQLLNNAKSNDVLHLLVGEPEMIPRDRGLGKVKVAQRVYPCFGVLTGNRVLFRAEIFMTPLREVIQAQNSAAS